MGLNFKGSDVSWSYSGFNSFRRELAAEIGINLDEMFGFGLPGRSWDKIKDDIVPFLNHSDCEGFLSPEDCQRVAPRLKELVDAWPKDDYDRVNAIELADYIAELGRRGQPLVFT